MPELHALSSGLKAVVTHQVAIGIEQCRMACGGHGYSDASGLPQLYGIAVGGCTYEGDNIVLLLQTARYSLNINMSKKLLTSLFRSRELQFAISLSSEISISL